MTSKFLAIAAVILAFRGSYLQKKSNSPEETKFSMLVSGSALILTGLALLARG